MELTDLDVEADTNIEDGQLRQMNFLKCLRKARKLLVRTCKALLGCMSTEQKTQLGGEGSMDKWMQPDRDSSNAENSLNEICSTSWKPVVSSALSLIDQLNSLGEEVSFACMRNDFLFKLFQLWHKFLNVFCLVGRNFISTLRKTSESRKLAMWEQSIHREVIEVDIEDVGRRYVMLIPNNQ